MIYVEREPERFGLPFPDDGLSRKLGGSDGRIKDFTVSDGAGTVTLNGNIVKIVPKHFSIEGPVITDGAQPSCMRKRSKQTGSP